MTLPTTRAGRGGKGVVCAEQQTVTRNAPEITAARTLTSNKTLTLNNAG